MRTARACIALVVLLNALAVSAPLPQARLDDVLARIRAAVAEGRAPSMAVAVGRGGRVVVAEAFGFADKAKRVTACPELSAMAGKGHKARFNSISNLPATAVSKVSLFGERAWGREAPTWSRSGRF
jgi:hypothetical protein